MSGNGIELRTLPLQRSKSDSPRKSKSVVIKSKETSGPKAKADKAVEVLTGRSSGIVIGFNKKRGRKVDENMNTAKKTEKKTGFREWFTKSPKPQKPKLSDQPKPESMQVGPIVERLQKQSAYLHATLQEENAKGATYKKSTEEFSFHNEDFTHKRHLLQNHSRPTWCDVCEDFIWGIYRSAIRCKCKYSETSVGVESLSSRCRLEQHEVSRSTWSFCNLFSITCSESVIQIQENHLKIKIILSCQLLNELLTCD